VAAALVAAAVVAAARCYRFMDVDVCLDRGGVWNEEIRECVGGR
jgi:hypothetical protein